MTCSSDFPEAFADVVNPDHVCTVHFDATSAPDHTGRMTVTEFCECLRVLGTHTDSIV